MDIRDMERGEYNVNTNYYYNLWNSRSYDGK